MMTNETRKWVKAYNNIYILNAGNFVAKLDLLETMVPIEYGGDKVVHSGSDHIHKRFSVKFKRYVLSVRTQDNIDFAPVCYFFIDTRNEDEIVNKYEREEQAKAYTLRLIPSIDSKFWPVDGNSPGQEIFARSIEILKAMAYL